MSGGGGWWSRGAGRGGDSLHTPLNELLHEMLHELPAGSSVCRVTFAAGVLSDSPREDKPPACHQITMITTITGTLSAF